MICHGCASRCMISDSANGSKCGVCSVGTLSAELTEAIWESANTRIWPGILAAERIQRLARPQHAADRQQVLDDIGRTDPGTATAACRRP